MANQIIDINIIDPFTGAAALGAGGLVFVAKAGTPQKANLFDPANGMAALANPMGPANGRIRFAVALAGSGQATPLAVDIYGYSSTGRAFVVKNVLPGTPTEIFSNSNAREQVLVIPFSYVDSIAATERDTGFVLPFGALVLPFPYLKVTALQATKTIGVGLLSSQSGGNATGFLAAASLAAVATVKGTANGASPTLGALLTVASGAGSTQVPEPYVVGATAVNVSYTTSATTTTAEGFIHICYLLPTI